MLPSRLNSSNASPGHATMMAAVSDTRATNASDPLHNNTNATSAPGTATAIASQRTRRSKCTAPRSDPISFPSEAMRRHAPVQRAAAQSKRLRRMTHIAVVPGQRLLDKRALRFVQREFFQSLHSRCTTIAQRKISRAHHVRGREENGALDCMLQLTNVTGPGVLHQRLHRGLIETGQLLVVTCGLAIEKMRSERRNVFSALAQRRQLQLDRVEPEQQILAEPPRCDFLAWIDVRR